MTGRSFYLTGPVDREALLLAVAGHFGIAPADAHVFTDWGEVLEHDPVRVAAFERFRLHIYLSAIDVVTQDATATFNVSLGTGRHRHDFEDRPLAHAVARALGQRIVFRDPAPDPRDHPIVEAAQIAVDPDGSETTMWLVEYGTDDGGSAMDILQRSSLDD